MSIDLGDEQVLVERLDSVESLSKPFIMLLDVIAPLEIDIHPHMGKPARVKLLDEGQVLRHFHGFVTASEYRKESPSGHHYRLTLRPWTYFLDQNRDFAIYNDKDAVTVIKKVLEEAGVSDVDFSKLSKPRATRVYCVQYRESDFAFISRLMEEEGIYYFFRHDSARHVMMLCESPNAHAAGTPASLIYNPASASVLSVDAESRGARARWQLHSWAERVSTTAGAKVTMRDYDFEKPERPLNVETGGQKDHPQDAQEIYTYPGNYIDEARGGDLGKVALDATRALRRVFAGASQATGIACGARLSVTHHPVDRMNASYVVISTHHTVVSETYRAVANIDDTEHDRVEFEAIPAETRFQAPLVTPRPLVQGLESAVVTGPDGETIYTDEYGRVKVRFHWDRHGRPGQSTTCWIRVSQTGGLGNLVLPRVGHEVLVDFLNGDPDKPLVVGRVFNKSHMPIYDLPTHKTRALWRTKTYGETGQYPDTKALDTGKPGVNEMRFEDKGGKEEVFLHGERDMNVRVRFDDSHHVGHNQDHMVGYNRQAFVGNDEDIKIGRNQTLDVHKNQERTIGENRKGTVGKNDTLDVGASRKLTAGQNVEYEAGTSIKLTVKGSSITIDPMGITIKAPMVKIEGQTIVEVKGLKTDVFGTAMLTLKGGMTMIN